MVQEDTHLISDAWKSEVERRLQKINRGEGSFIDGETFIKERLAAYRP